MTINTQPEEVTHTGPEVAVGRTSDKTHDAHSQCVTSSEFHLTRFFLLSTLLIPGRGGRLFRSPAQEAKVARADFDGGKKLEEKKLFKIN